MKVVSLIPARGGSKGIPRKNLTILAGKPLIYYAIKALQESLADEVWVSTDDKEIKDASLVFGAEVLDRPSELAGDKSTTEEVMLHFIENVDTDILILVQCTSPLVRAQDINDGIKMVKSKIYDSVFSAVSLAKNDILLWSEYKSYFTPMNYDIIDRGRRQEREGNLYIETGSFYITTRNGFINSKCRLNGRIGVVEIPLWNMFEVDTIEDLKNIEKLMRD
jgi:CMP-N,N'-diacetyllegionaminic acid synthase